jgi:hypothetical protein
MAATPRLEVGVSIAEVLSRLWAQAGDGEVEEAVGLGWWIGVVLGGQGDADGERDEVFDRDLSADRPVLCGSV